MASTNQSPEYQRAEKQFLLAETNEDKLFWLEEMLKFVPKHKSAENMRANLRTRYKKLKQSIAKQKKSGKSSQQGIKKDDMQYCIVGMPNSGKSTLFEVLTEQESTAAAHAFSTYQPELGSTDFEDVKIQTIDMPPFPNHDASLINVTDVIFLVVDKIEQIGVSKKYLDKTNAKIFIIFNKIDLISENEKRKIMATLKSKYPRYECFLISAKNPGIDDIKKMKKALYDSFPVIRVYTKEPKKEATDRPMVLKRGSSVEDVAEKILKGMSKNIKKAKIWGPSGKFLGQTVGLEHVLKDKDIVELQTK